MQIYTQKEIFKNDESVVLLKKKKDMVVVESPHLHEFTEFVYVLSGSSIQSVDNKEHKVERGSVIYIPQGQVHNAVFDDKMACIEILVKPEIIDGILNSISASGEKVAISHTFYDFTGDKRRKLENLVEEMLSEYKDNDINSENVIKNYLSIFITHIIRHSETATPKYKGIPIEVIDYINIHFRKHFTLEELAQMSFYSPKYFSRIFKQSFGITVTEYIAQKRVAEGCHLLTETNMSIDEISKNLGWENNTQFFSNFKKFYGMTPHAYRKSRR